MGIKRLSSCLTFSLVAIIVSITCQAGVAQTAALNPITPVANQALGRLLDTFPSLVSPSQTVKWGRNTFRPSLRLKGGRELKVVGSMISASISTKPQLGYEFDLLNGKKGKIIPELVDVKAQSVLVVNQDSAFFADTAPSTDTIIRPDIDGISELKVLYSSDSPQAFNWRIKLPKSMRLVKIGKRIGVRYRNRRKKADVFWQQGFAFDRNGREVKTEIKFTSPNKITLKVFHRNKGYTYPIVASDG